MISNIWPRFQRNCCAMVVTCSMCWAGACGPLDRVCLTDTLSTYPAFVSNLNSGFALTASPFLKDQKGTKKSSPHRTAFASLRFPRSGSAPWARRHGPSMAHRGSPGIHAGRPTPQNLLSASREGWQIKSTAPRGGRPAGLFGGEVCEPRTSPLWERACSRWHRRA